MYSGRFFKRLARENSRVREVAIRSLCLALKLLHTLGTLALLRRRSMLTLDCANIRRVLAVKLGGLGDFVVFTPVLDNLRLNLPGAEITLITSSVGAEVVRGARCIDDVIINDKIQGVSQHFRLLRELRRKKFDLSISSVQDTGLLLAVFLWLAGVKYRIGFRDGGREFLYHAKLQIDGTKHIVDRHLDSLSPLGIHAPIRKPFVHISDQDANFAKKFLKSNNRHSERILVGAHTYSFWPANQWPYERWRELLYRLRTEFNADVLLIGGPEEMDSTNRLIESMNWKPINAVGKTTVKQMAALVQQCKLLVTTDSAPMHIAAAMRTPVVALFGRENPMLWRPYSDESMVTIVKRDVSCAPCRKFSCSNPICMNAITVAEVVAAIKDQLAKYPASANTDGALSATSVGLRSSLVTTRDSLA